MFADFTIGMIENEMGHLFECAKLYRNVIIKSET